MACGDTTTIACDLGALSVEERAQRQRLADSVWPAAREVRELADGYAVRLPADATTYRQATDLVLLEHRCCPFFHLGIELEPGDGPLWIKLTGGTGVKEFLRQSGITQLAQPSAPACACC